MYVNWNQWDGQLMGLRWKSGDCPRDKEAVGTRSASHCFHTVYSHLDKTAIPSPMLPLWVHILEFRSNGAAQNSEHACKHIPRFINGACECSRTKQRTGGIVHSSVHLFIVLQTGPHETSHRHERTFLDSRVGVLATGATQNSSACRDHREEQRYDAVIVSDHYQMQRHGFKTHISRKGVIMTRWQIPLHFIAVVYDPVTGKLLYVRPYTVTALKHCWPGTKQTK